MLCVIAAAADFTKQIQGSEAIGVVRHNHQVRPVVVEARGYDSVNAAHLFL